MKGLDIWLGVMCLMVFGRELPLPSSCSVEILTFELAVNFVPLTDTVYDVTRRDTFTNLSDIWAKEIDLYSTNPDCIKMLVGNKVDKVSLFKRFTIVCSHYILLNFHAWVVPNQCYSGISLLPSWDLGFQFNSNIEEIFTQKATSNIFQHIYV